MQKDTGGRLDRQCAGGVRLAQRANREFCPARIRRRGEGKEDGAPGRLEGWGTLKRRRPGVLSAWRLPRAAVSVTASSTGLSESRGTQSTCRSRYA
ncbi:hypothetical protein IG631_19428 [Alternaria alternata]|nr:hypothetical protein IG631_19428 [Alternaria alternata]